MIFKPEQREHDTEYMGAIAKLPCLACMARGTITWGVHVAHLRAASPEHGKPYTAKGRKPSDRWTLPLCPPHHTGDSRKVRETQHDGDEVAFWQIFGINPFEACLELGTAYDQGKPLHPIIAAIAAEGRKHRP